MEKAWAGMSRFESVLPRRYSSMSRRVTQAPSRREVAMDDQKLELEVDRDFQRREWRFQRAGWIVLAACVLAGAAGVFGDGPLAGHSAKSPTGALEVSYDRLARKGAPQVMTVRVRAPVNPTRLWLSREAATKLDVKRVEPEPDQVEAGSEKLVYDFRSAAGTPELIVTFHVDPKSPSVFEASIGIVGGEAVSFTQVIFP
jgi:hypothetical protein